MRRVAAVTDRSGSLGDRRERGRRHDLERRRMPRPHLEGQGRLVQEESEPAEGGGAALARGHLHRRDGRVVQEVDDEGLGVERRQRELLAVARQAGSR